MKEIIKGKYISYTEYNPKCPFDVAQSIADWEDGIDEKDIASIVHVLHTHGLLNDFGEKVHNTFQLRSRLRVSDDNLKKLSKDIQKFHKDFDKWVKENNWKLEGVKDGKD